MTAQLHEKLFYDGESTTMACSPPLPDWHPRLVEVDQREALRDPTAMPLFSAACTRRYQGTWEIKDGELYLVALRGCYRLTPGSPLLAEWFTGELRVPRGQILEHVHVGFESVYEEEVRVQVEEGVVVGSTTIDNRPGPDEP